jgi:hypothetical protein
VIELSSQAFVLSSGFRLVPFGVQIVAKAVGSRVFPFADLDPRRIERPKATTPCKNDTVGIS